MKVLQNDPPSRIVLDAAGVGRALARIAHEVVERSNGVADLGIIGIRSRGDHLALRLQGEILKLEGEQVPFGAMDITLYRDDITRGADHAVIKSTEIPWEVDGKTILLVDDVLFTGRTIRAALDALMDFGRPRAIQLAVLVDRGHRELPIQPDYVGRAVSTAFDERVTVFLDAADGAPDQAVVEPGPAGEALRDSAAPD